MKSLKDGYWIENPLLLDYGFKTGDKVVSINGNPIVNDSDIGTYLIEAQTVVVDRDGEKKTIDLPEDFLGQLSSSKKLGLFEKRIPFMVGSVSDSSLNKSKDLKEGDIFESVNGQPVKYYDQLEDVMKKYKDTTLKVQILRGDQTMIKELAVDSNGKFGIQPGFSDQRFTELGYYDVITKEYSFTESFGAGWAKFKKTLGSYGAQLKAIFTPSTGAYKGVGGFKAIFDIFPSVWSWQAFWMLTAFLSIMLAVLNLLPIPALDGGHVMFLLYEMVSGRKPSEKFLERAQLVGFFILIGLVLFANGNDIFKAFFN